MDEVIYVSHSANTLQKFITQTILPPTLGKYLDRLCSLACV